MLCRSHGACPTRREVDGGAGQGYAVLRLPRMNAGGSDRLPLSCFRLRGTIASQFGAVSGGPSTGRTRGPGGTLPVTGRASPSAVGGVCAGTMPQRVVPLARV